MKKNLTVGILIAFGFANLPIGSALQRSSQQGYAMAMDSWEKSEKALIAPSAKEMIAESFEQHRGELADFGGDRVWNGSDRTLMQTLVLYYLSDLRDLKIRRLSPDPLNPLSTAENRATSETGESQIDSSDVGAYPIDKFLNRIQPVLKSAKGELHVLSNPTGASITLDTVKRGYTEKITIESAGDHRIMVAAKKGSMRCEDKVVIPANGSVTFHCP